MGSTTAKAIRYGPCVTRGSHSFTCHPHMNHTCLYSPAARHYHWYSLRLPTKGWPGWVDLSVAECELIVWCCRNHGWSLWTWKELWKNSMLWQVTGIIVAFLHFQTSRVTTAGRTSIKDLRLKTPHVNSYLKKVFYSFLISVPYFLVILSSLCWWLDRLLTCCRLWGWPGSRVMYMVSNGDPLPTVRFLLTLTEP